MSAEPAMGDDDAKTPPGETPTPTTWFGRAMAFINDMDSRAQRAVIVSVALLVLVAAVFIIGRSTAIFDEDAAWRMWLESLASSPWALPATIILFTLAAFVGAPQFFLIAVTVAAFGPSEGFLYAWVATLVSASVNFWLGRTFGADILRRYGGATVNKVTRFVGRNGFMAALLVRIIPSAPFIVVNTAMGVSGMAYLLFISGTALGIVPKTALIAFFGGSLEALLAGAGWEAWAAIAGGVAAWIALMLVARRVLRKRYEAEE